MVKSIETRIEQAEKKLCIGDKPFVFEYTDENGIERKVEMPAADFNKLLNEIDGTSRGLPVKEGVMSYEQNH